MRKSLVLILFALAACNDEPNAEEQARIDAEAVAAVEAANNIPPPLEEVVPEIISDGDIAAANIEGARCTYMPGTNASPRLIARSLDAYMKLDGELVRLAADSGSLEMASGTRRLYNGRALTVQVDIVGDEGSITIRDPYDRVVYAGSGPVSCVEGETAPDNPDSA